MMKELMARVELVAVVMELKIILQDHQELPTRVVAAAVGAMEAVRAEPAVRGW